MDSDGKFWIATNAIIGFTIIAVAFLSTNYWNNHNTKIVELVSEGVDPVAAMCAMQDDYGKMPVCIVLAVKKAD